MGAFISIFDRAVFAFDDFISTGSYIVDRNKQHIQKKNFKELQFAILFVKLIVFTYIAIKMIYFLINGKTTYKESVRFRLLISIVDLLIILALIKMFVDDVREEIKKKKV